MALRRPSPRLGAVDDQPVRFEVLRLDGHECPDRILFLDDLLAIRNVPSVDLNVLNEAGFEILYLDSTNIHGVSIADCAREAAHAVRSVGWSSCHIIGCGFGGMVAQLIATRHPGIVERLVLVSTESTGADSNLLGKQLHQYSPLGFQAAYWVHYHEFYTRYWPIYYITFLMAWICLLLASYIVPQNSELLKKQQKQFDSYCKHDTAAALEQLKCRIMVCYSADDGVVHEDSALKLEAIMPTSTLHDFDGGHQLLKTDPAALPMITDFLRACESNRVDEF